MNPQDPLAALAPLRTPPPVAAWPPAPGWWILAALLLLLLAAVTVLLWRRYRRTAYLRHARRELAAIRERHGDDPATLAQAVNALLKRAALARFPRRGTAELAGARWVAFLNASAPEAAFDDRAGELPYAPAPAPGAVDEFCAGAERWLRRPRRPREAA